MLKLAPTLAHRMALTMLTVAFCAATKADAQPATGTTAAEPSVDSSSTVLQLEKHIQKLEARIRDLEQQCPDANRKASKIRNGRQAPNNDASKLAIECSPPYFVDPDGMRHFRQECLQSSPKESCDDPFVLDASGIKRVKVACLTQ
jgi:hypothetical protein